MKVIITDLDNTLLHSNKSISEYSIEVLLKCRSKGLKIIFATARSAQAASGWIKQLQPDIFIGYGGALITSADGKVIKRFDIPADIAQKLIKELRSTAEIFSISAVNENTALSNHSKYIENKENSHYCYFDFSTDLDQSFLKISVNSNSKYVLETIAKKYLMCDLLHFSNETLSRFANKEAVKWNAVKAAANYLSISTDNFIAFGDDYNDLEMIQNCGIGVAVENAIDDVKAIANAVCDTNDHDGVAKWIEQNIL